jgi:hypothetical protein
VDRTASARADGDATGSRRRSARRSSAARSDAVSCLITSLVFTLGPTEFFSRLNPNVLIAAFRAQVDAVRTAYVLFAESPVAVLGAGWSAVSVMSYVANGIRIFIALAMLVTFIFRRWIAWFLSLVWRRVIEDKKGAFTLLFGGIGGIAGAVKEVLSHF